MSIKSTAAIATAFVIAASVPFAASANQSDVQGLSGLEIKADRILDKNGFENVDPTTLSLGALVEIIDFARDDDRVGSPKAGIQAALNRFEPKS